MATQYRSSSYLAIAVLNVILLLAVGQTLLPLALFLILLAVVAFIVFVLVALTHSYVSNKRFEKEYRAFLQKMNGARFFCYNSRKSSIAFAQEVIVPELDSAIQVVFVDGRKIDSGVDSKFVSRMLYGIKDRKRFPYLLKIMDGQVLECSVNNQFYSTMIGKKSIAPLVARINTFYDFSTPHSS